MKDTQLIKVLKTLSKQELKQLGEFVNAEHFNKNEHVAVLSTYLSDQSSETKDESAHDEIGIDIPSPIPGTYHWGLLSLTQPQSDHNFEEFKAYLQNATPLLSEEELRELQVLEHKILTARENTGAKR